MRVRKVKFYLLIIWLSTKKIFKQNLSDQVKYKGKKYFILNGTRPNYWRLDLDNNDEGWVRRSECKKVISLRNLLFSFKDGYNFYINCWYKIWIQQGIQDWMRGCNIW